MAGNGFEALRDALVQAFPSEDALRGELLLRMGLRLPVIAGAGRSLAVTTLDVLEYVDARGRVEELVASASALRPQHQVLREVVAQYWPALLTPAAAIPIAAAQPRARNTALSDDDWQNLVGAIRDRKCTPVIGPGACLGVLPESAQLAAEWANRWQYPLADRGDLTRVSQFLALTHYPLQPHEQVHRRYSAVQAPAFDSPDEPHGLLADLDLPLYLTTNYDDFMTRALASRRIRASRTFPCWNQNLREQAVEAGPQDALGSPLVYHLFGHHEIPESMVLTEDDHLNFLSSIAADPKLLPPIVKRALGGTSLLFIGHGVLDWGFRVLIRALLASVTVSNMRLGVAVQLPPDNLSEAQRTQVENYLQRFLNDRGHFNFSVFWGDTREFTRTLRDHWERRGGHDAAR